MCVQIITEYIDTFIRKELYRVKTHVNSCKIIEPIVSINILMSYRFSACPRTGGCYNVVVSSGWYDHLACCMSETHNSSTVHWFSASVEKLNPRAINNSWRPSTRSFTLAFTMTLYVIQQLWQCAICSIDYCMFTICGDCSIDMTSNNNKFLYLGLSLGYRNERPVQ